MFRIQRKGDGDASELFAGAGQSDECCRALITDYLRRRGLAGSPQIDAAVFPALSIELTEEQKRSWDCSFGMETANGIRRNTMLLPSQLGIAWEQSVILRRS